MSAARTATIHVLVVERDHFSRIGLEQILGGTGEIVVSATVSTVAEAEQLSSRTLVDVALVGCDVTDMEGADGISRLLTRYPRARVVVLGSAVDPIAVTTAIRGGADGYLPRNTPQEGLVRALQAVTRGEVAIPRSLIPVLVDALRIAGPPQDTKDAAERLSPRERQVVTELARGRSNAEIAQRLGLKESTVKTHVSNILRKTGSRSRFVLRSVC